jgi:hypothetical protein
MDGQYASAVANTRIHFGHGAGSVMKTSSYSERIFGELYATSAALTFLRCQLKSCPKTNNLHSGKIEQDGNAQSKVETKQKLGIAPWNYERLKWAAFESQNDARQ